MSSFRSLRKKNQLTWAELDYFHLSYLVRDINSPIYFHQSTNMFFNKLWCCNYSTNAVKCNLMPKQDLKKFGLFQSKKKRQMNILIEKNRGLVNWWIDVTNKWRFTYQTNFLKWNNHFIIQPCFMHLNFMLQDTIHNFCIQ